MPCTPTIILYVFMWFEFIGLYKIDTQCYHIQRNWKKVNNLLYNYTFDHSWVYLQNQSKLSFEVCSKNFLRIKLACMFTLNKPKKIAVNFTLQCKVDIYNFTGIPCSNCTTFCIFQLLFNFLMLHSSYIDTKNSLQLFTFLYVWLTSMPFFSSSLAIHVSFAILHDFLQIEQCLIFFTHNINLADIQYFLSPRPNLFKPPELDFIYLWEKKYRADPWSLLVSRNK